MRYYQLNMGEGIAGPESIGAGCTTTFSCMGIAFVNRAKKFGGLYHYPANCLDRNVTATIGQMIQDIQPTEIYLTPAPADSMGWQGSTPEDVEAVSKFLCSQSTAEFQLLKPAAQTLIWVEGQPVLNMPVAKQKDLDPQRVSLTTRSKMSSGARQLEGDVWYYGGDGEIEGVLQQGVKPANSSKKASRRHCMIL
jgi:hypothetical protein